MRSQGSRINIMEFEKRLERRENSSGKRKEKIRNALPKAFYLKTLSKNRNV